MGPGSGPVPVNTVEAMRAVPLMLPGVCPAPSGLSEPAMQRRNRENPRCNYSPLR